MDIGALPKSRGCRCGWQLILQFQQYLGNLMDAYPGPVRVLAPDDGPANATERGEGVVVRNTQTFMWPTPRVGDWAVREAEAFQPDVVLFGAPYPLPWLGPRLQEALRVPVGVGAITLSPDGRWLAFAVGAGTNISPRRIQQLDVDTLDRWSARLLDAERLEDVFADDPE